MLRQKVINENVTTSLYDSSNVVASTYDTSNNNLTVIFKFGGSYTYLDVPHTDYFRFETAESQGKVLNSSIKKFKFVKNEDVDVKVFEDEILLLKESEIKSHTEDMVEYMRMFISSVDTGNVITNQAIERINHMTNHYLQINE